ncbi:hypothetical protein NMY22_g19450 [Coprinellus aureogranulatus]|nr:hypothetical protein NMY22_g19450 [Coprinellus aureogranulatus]
MTEKDFPCVAQLSCGNGYEIMAELVESDCSIQVRGFQPPLAHTHWSCYLPQTHPIAERVSLSLTPPTPSVPDGERNIPSDNKASGVLISLVQALSSNTCSFAERTPFILYIFVPVPTLDREMDSISSATAPTPLSSSTYDGVDIGGDRYPETNFIDCIFLCKAVSGRKTRILLCYRHPAKVFTIELKTGLHDRGRARRSLTVPSTAESSVSPLASSASAKNFSPNALGKKASLFFSIP